MIEFATVPPRADRHAELIVTRISGGLGWRGPILSRWKRRSVVDCLKTKIASDAPDERGLRTLRLEGRGGMKEKIRAKRKKNYSFREIPLGQNWDTKTTSGRALEYFNSRIDKKEGAFALFPLSILDGTRHLGLYIQAGKFPIVTLYFAKGKREVDCCEMDRLF